MRILLVNDDGIDAQGIKILEEIASDFTDDIWVVAPLHDQSGCSRSITLQPTLMIHEIGTGRYAVKGTPVDCVRVALGVLMSDHLPDLVLSGVNWGANLAEDLGYSGTCGAILEARVMGYSGIAFSQAHQGGDSFRFSSARSHLRTILTQLIEYQSHEPCSWSVNFPACDAQHVTGVHVVPQGQRSYDYQYEILQKNERIQQVSLGMNRYIPDDRLSNGDDVSVVANNGIAVVPIQPFYGRDAALEEQFHFNLVL